MACREENIVKIKIKIYMDLDFVQFKWLPDLKCPFKCLREQPCPNPIKPYSQGLTPIKHVA